MRIGTERGFYGQLAGRFGLNAHQLDLLFRLKRGDDISGGNSGVVLDRKGLTESGYDCTRRLTERGLAVCAEARRLGY
jgi:hypothetical protein